MESKYNSYKNVDEKKQRPILIWNNASSFDGKVISFYCTTKKNKHNKWFLIKYDVKKDGTECFVNLSRMFIVDSRDINWSNRWHKIKDPDVRDNIKNKINQMFSK